MLLIFWQTREINHRLIDLNCSGYTGRDIGPRSFLYFPKLQSNDQNAVEPQQKKCRQHVCRMHCSTLTRLHCSTLTRLHCSTTLRPLQPINTVSFWQYVLDWYNFPPRLSSIILVHAKYLSRTVSIFLCCDPHLPSDASQHSDWMSARCESFRESLRLDLFDK